jgi:hypothetical protein
MHKALSEASAYEVPQQDCEKLLISGAAAADRLLRYSSVMFRLICKLMGKHGMVDESALFEEMYTASVRRMDLQILRPRHCLDLASC